MFVSRHHGDLFYPLTLEVMVVAPSPTCVSTIMQVICASANLTQAGSLSFKGHAVAKATWLNEEAYATGYPYPGDLFYTMTSKTNPQSSKLQT